MKNILRQTGIIIAFFSFWYLLFLLLSYHLYPISKVIDNSRVGHSNHVRGDVLKGNIYLYDAPNILLGSWLSKHNTNRIIILGASNSVKMRAAIMQKILPDFSVNHATVRGSNVTQLRNVVDVFRMSSQGSLKRTIFIINLFCGTFINNKSSMGHVVWKNKNLTYFEAEGLRYGLYKLSNNTLEPTLDPHFMPLAVHLLRPFLLGEIILYDIKLYYDNFWLSLHPSKGSPQDSQGEEMKRASLVEWKNAYGDIREYMEAPEMDSFISLCKEIEQSGGSVVVVELPTPSWMHGINEYYKKYISKRQLYINKIETIPRVRYIDLATLLPPIPDADFVDSVHPTQEEAEVWEKAISQYVLSQRRFLGF